MILTFFRSAVTCLSVSIDGLALISGSNDNTIKIWHIISKQCMRTVTNKGITKYSVL